MDAKAYLKQYLELKSDIECKKAENEQWLYIAGGITPPTLGERVQSSGNPHRSEDAVLRYMRKVEENEAEIKRCREKMAEILSVIEMVDDKILRKILLLQYTEGKDLHETAFAIRYSHSYTKDLKSIAIRKVQKLIDEKEKRAR